VDAGRNAGGGRLTMVMMVGATTKTTARVFYVQGGSGTIDNDYHQAQEKPSLRG